MYIQQMGVQLLEAGKATCAATDKSIPTTGFNRVVLKNLDATNEIVVTIDEDSTTSPAKPIYLEAGESFSEYISGMKLHYSAASGTPVLKYVIL